MGHLKRSLVLHKVFTNIDEKRQCYSGYLERRIVLQKVLTNSDEKG